MLDTSPQHLPTVPASPPDLSLLPSHPQGIPRGQTGTPELAMPVPVLSQFGAAAGLEVEIIDHPSRRAVRFVSLVLPISTSKPSSLLPILPLPPESAPSPLSMEANCSLSSWVSPPSPFTSTLSSLH